MITTHLEVPDKWLQLVGHLLWHRLIRDTLQLLQV